MLWIKTPENEGGWKFTLHLEQEELERMSHAEAGTVFDGGFSTSEELQALASFVARTTTVVEHETTHCRHNVPPFLCAVCLSEKKGEQREPAN